MAAESEKGMKVTTPMKEYISRHLTGEWKTLGRQLLGVTASNTSVETTLNNFARDFPKNARKCCYLVLSEWQNRLGDEATVDGLIKGLTYVGQRLIADNLEKVKMHLLESSQAVQPTSGQDVQGTPSSQIGVHPAKPSPPDIKSYQPVELKHKKLIYLHIGASWAELGEELGLSNESLKKIEASVNSLTHRCEKMLDLREGRMCGTVGELEAALWRLCEGNLALELVEL